MKKCLYLDLETSGLDPHNNGILQIAAIYEEDGQVIDSFVSHMKPPRGTKIDKEALEVNGLKRKQIRRFEPSADVFKRFLAFLDRYLDKYDKEDKVTLIGYNVGFDRDFLYAWAKRNDYEYMYAYIDYRLVDVMVLTRTAWLIGNIKTPENFKLGTMCKVYGVEEPNHDAHKDIEATRELFYKVVEKW